jgi:Domain of unknown function (DUF4386)
VRKMSAMLLRTGSAAAIVGALTLFVGTMLHPMTADPGDAAAAFGEYAADRWWVATHLAQFAGVALMFVGMYALTRSLRDDPVGWLANLALLVAMAALATAAVLQAVDGVALKIMVDRWAAAPPTQKQSAFEAAFAVRQIEVGVASFTALLFGTAIVLLGIALTASARYPAWLGWLGVIGGGGTAAGGVLMAFTGFSHAATNLMMPFNLAVLAWMIAAGVLMWRQAA